MTNDEKRAALLSDRVITGLKDFGPKERKKVIDAITDVYCLGCGEDDLACACMRELKEGARA